MTRHYYLAPWQVVTVDEGGSHFAPPDGCVGVIDLRSIPGHADVPFGFFVLPDDRAVPDGELFGTGHLADVTPTEQSKGLWASMLGIGETIESVSLLDLLWDTLTIYADPSGDDLVRPLMPTVGLQYELHLGGHSLVRRKRCRPNGNPREQAEWQETLAVVQAGLLSVREQARAGRAIDPVTKQPDGEYHQRVMQAAMDKYRLPFESLRPAAWPAREAPKPHRTTISDNFDGTDGDSIGNLLSWTEVSGDWDRVSNRAQLETAAANNSARADSDLSSVDHYGQVVVTSLSAGNSARWAGACCRFASAAETFYVARMRGDNEFFQTYKCITGTYTPLGSSTDEDPTAPYSLRISANGTTVERFLAGVSKESITDTAIDGTTVGGLRCGIGGNSGNASNRTILDDFEAADLAAPPAGGPFPHHTRRLLSGGMSNMRGGTC